VREPPFPRAASGTDAYVAASATLAPATGRGTCPSSFRAGLVAPRLAGRRSDRRLSLAQGPDGHSRALIRSQVAALRRFDVPLRDKTLWRTCMNTAARAREILALGF
jgi:hypothetical protein